MWNERYAAPGFLFGTEPAAFLKAQRGHFPPRGTALAVADGEGRNSIYLAACGLTVSAMDFSEVALEEARGLAAERGVAVDFRQADIHAWDWAPETFDLVAAIFIQFATPAERARIFAGMKRTLKPGGLLLLHGYRPEQLDYGTGGPPHGEHMYTEVLLRDAFGDMDVLRLAAYDEVIEEGTAHAGMSALIDLVARKPNSPGPGRRS